MISFIFLEEAVTFISLALFTLLSVRPKFCCCHWLCRIKTFNFSFVFSVVSYIIFSVTFRQSRLRCQPLFNMLTESSRYYLRQLLSQKYMFKKKLSKECHLMRVLFERLRNLVTRCFNQLSFKRAQLTPRF